MKFSSEEVRKDWLEVVESLSNFKNSAENPYHGNKYVPLHQVLRDLKPAFKNKGFDLIQEARYSNGIVEVQSVFLHEKGTAESEWIGTEAKKDPQGTIGATTYLRRVQLLMICGLCSVDDDDGNGATSSTPIDIKDRIRNAKTKEELKAVWETIDEKEQRSYGEMVNKRLGEIGGTK